MKGVHIEHFLSAKKYLLEDTPNGNKAPHLL